MNIHLHIERLVIDEEVASGELHGIRQGLQRELAGLLHAGGLSHEFREGAALPSVRGGAIHRPADRETASLGSRVAHAIYEGIGPRK